MGIRFLAGETIDGALTVNNTITLSGASNAASTFTLTNTAPTPDSTWTFVPQYNSQDLVITGTGKFDVVSSGGTGRIDSNGQIESIQALDVATAGGRFTGKSNRGSLGSIHIEQTTTSVDGGYINLRTSASGSTNPTERFRITDTGAFSVGPSGTNYGSSGQVLTSQGNGVPAWATPTTGTVTGSGTATRVAFWSASDTISSHADFYWDNANDRLGIGVGSAPLKKLNVQGTVRIQTNANYYSDRTYLGDTWEFASDTTDGVTFSITGGLAATAGNYFRWLTQEGAATPIERMRIDSAGKIQVGSDKVIWAGGYGGGLVIRQNNATGDRLIKMVTVDSTGAIVSDNVLVAKGANVGIGTDSPHAPLTIYNATSSLAIQNSATGTGGSQGLYLGVSTGTIGYLWNYENDDLVFGANNLERMKVTGAGAIEIKGTSTTTYAQAFLTNDNTSLTIGSSVSASVDKPLNLQVGGTNRLIIDSTGNVGIGVSTINNPFTAQAALQVGDTSTTTNNGLITIGSGTAGSGDIYFADGTSGGSAYRGFVSYKHNGDYLAFGTAETTRMIIDTSGNVGIGVTPSNAFVDSRAIEIGANGTIWSEQASGVYNSIMSGVGFYYNAAGATIYKTTSLQISRHVQYQGEHIFQYAAAGTAGGAITWSEAFRTSDTGNVGIGTTGPTAKLQIGSNVDPSQTAESLVHLLSSTTSSTVNGFTHLKLDYTSGASPGTAGAQIMFNQGYHPGNTDYTQPVGSIRGWKTGADYNYGGGLQLLYQPDAGALGVLVGMTLTGGGNVGIGVTSPNYKLSVANANTRIISATYIDGANGIMSHAGAPNYGLESFQVRGDIISFWTDYDASHYQGTEKMRIDQSGNVGIGTDSPTQAKLCIDGTQNSIYLTRGGVTDTKWTISSDSVSMYISEAGVGYIMTLKENGYVGIGTTGPSYKLDIRGSSVVSMIRTLDTTSPTLGLFVNDGSNGVGTISVDDGGHMTFDTGSTGAGQAEKVRITAGGDVGINDTTPSYKLDVDGTIRATGDVIAYSDIRVKDNIKTIDNALEKTIKLRGVSYTRNDIDDTSTKIGIIAQEVLKVLPEVVSQDDKGKYSVAYGNISGLLIEAIKEQQKQIDSLQEQIKKMSSEN